MRSGGTAPRGARLGRIGQRRSHRGDKSDAHTSNPGAPELHRRNLEGRSTIGPSGSGNHQLRFATVPAISRRN
jgi:hypothetical protein